MNVFICIPVKHPIGPGLLRAVCAKGFTGARFDLETDHHPTKREQLLEWNQVPEMAPLILLAGGHMKRNDGAAWTGPALVDHTRDVCFKLQETGLAARTLAPVLEIGNEPDLADERWKRNPEELGRVFADCFRQAQEIIPGLTVLTPSISNLIDQKNRGLRYLEAMAPHLPDDCAVAFHRYPAGRDPWEPHKGFRTRSHEVERLRELVGGRELWVTETGFSEWVSDGRRVSAEEAAGYMDADLHFWRDHGVETACVYQLNSGRWAHEGSFDSKRLATYGIRTIEGQWKPLADRMPELAEDLA